MSILQDSGLIKRDIKREDQLVDTGKRFKRVGGWQIVRNRNDLNKRQ
jgi:hypothetical protein